MLVNGFTIIAQLINFIILVILLRKFLYQPILNTIETRQQRIQYQWQEAHFQRQKAEQEQANLRQQQQQIQQKLTALMVEAKQKAQKYQQGLMQQAKEEVSEMKTAWIASIHSQQNLFLNHLRQQVIQQTTAMTRKILQEIADANLESQAVFQFIQKLQHLSPSEQQQLINSLNTANESLFVRSGLELSLADQTKIVEALENQLNLENQLYVQREEQTKDKINENKIELQFITVPDLICGIELRVGGDELSWSFEQELKQLNQQLSQVIQHEMEKNN